MTKEEFETELPRYHWIRTESDRGHETWEKSENGIKAITIIQDGRVRVSVAKNSYKIGEMRQCFIISTSPYKLCCTDGNGRYLWDILL